MKYISEFVDVYKQSRWNEYSIKPSSVSPVAVSQVINQNCSAVRTFRYPLRVLRGWCVLRSYSTTCIRPSSILQRTNYCIKWFQQRARAPPWDTKRLIACQAQTDSSVVEFGPKWRFDTDVATQERCDTWHYGNKKSTFAQTQHYFTTYKNELTNMINIVILPYS
jgi:hypothetical protein